MPIGGLKLDILSPGSDAAVTLDTPIATANADTFTAPFIVHGAEDCRTDSGILDVMFIVTGDAPDDTETEPCTHTAAP